MKAIFLIISVILLIGFTLKAQVEDKPETKNRKEKVNFEKRTKQPLKYKTENTLYEKRHKKDSKNIEKSKAIREEKKKK